MGSSTKTAAITLVQYIVFDQNQAASNHGQKKDKWNLVTGMNWDFNKRFSWSLEYDGFIGSQEAFISSVTWRF